METALQSDQIHVHMRVRVIQLEDNEITRGLFRAGGSFDIEAHNRKFGAVGLVLGEDPAWRNIWHVRHLDGHIAAYVTGELIEEKFNDALVSWLQK